MGGLAFVTDIKPLWHHLVTAPLEAPQVCEAACMAVADVAKALGDHFAALALEAVAFLAACLERGRLVALRAFRDVLQVLGSRTPRWQELLSFTRQALQAAQQGLTKAPGAPPGAPRGAAVLRLPRSWMPQRARIHSERQELLEAVLDAHEALLSCSRRQGLASRRA